MPRILHLSDLHAHWPWYQWAHNVARHYDAVSVSGDFLNACSPTPLVEQVKRVSTWTKEFPVPLFVCSGNHDWDESLPPTMHRWVEDLASDKVTTDSSLTTLGYWTIECVAWGSVPRPTGRQSLALVHCPPSGAETALVEEVGIDYGDIELASMLRYGDGAPEIVLSGHVHWRRRFFDRLGFSLSLNPGWTTGDQPNHVIVDLDYRTADFVGNDGKERETVSF